MSARPIAHSRRWASRAFACSISRRICRPTGTARTTRRKQASPPLIKKSAQLLTRVRFPERSQAALRSLHRWERAPFLLDQVEFNSARFLRSLKQLLPWSHTFAEKHPVSLSLFGGPILAVHGHNAAGIRFDPGNRIRSSLNTRADVELQHHVLARVRGEHFHGALTLDGDELGFVIVVARAETQRLQLFGGAAQDIRHTLPAIEAVDSSRAGHDDELAPDDLVDLDGVWTVFCGE